MTPARHQPIAEFLFRNYIFRLQKKHFHGFYFIGEKPVLDAQQPFLLLPNHNSWWDGFWVYLLNEKMFRRKIFMMMLEEQIQRYSFFSRVGAFGIAPDRPKDTLRSLNYSLEILDQKQSPGALLCIYPEGDLTPWSVPGAEYKPGVDWILQKWNKPIQVGLLAMKSRLFDQQKADVFFHLKVLKLNKDIQKWDLQDLHNQHQSLLKELDEQLKGNPDTQTIFSGRQSIQEKFDRFRVRKV